MGNMFTAHLFGRSKRGDREEVRIKLFELDGSPFAGGRGGQPPVEELWAYGHSLLVVDANPTVVERIGRALGLPADAIHNRAVDGGILAADEDPATSPIVMVGGAVRVLQDWPGAALPAPFDQPRAFGADKYAMIQHGFNDLIWGEVFGQSSDGTLFGVEGSLRAAIARLRASRVDESNGGAPIAYAAPDGAVAAWTNVASVLRNSGSGYHRQSNPSGGTLPGSAITYTIPDGYRGEPIFWGFIGHADSDGVIWTIKVDGVTVATYDLSDFDGAIGNYTALGVRLAEVAPTAAVVTATPSIPAGKAALFDYVSIEAGLPGPIQVLGNPRWPEATYDIFHAGGAASLEDTTLTELDDVLESVCAEFDSLVLYTPMMSATNKQRHLFSLEAIGASPAGIHFSNAGAARVAARAASAYWNQVDLPVVAPENAE